MERGWDGSRIGVKKKSEILQHFEIFVIEKSQKDGGGNVIKGALVEVSLREF